MRLTLSDALNSLQETADRLAAEDDASAYAGLLADVWNPRHGPDRPLGAALAAAAAGYHCPPVDAGRLLVTGWLARTAAPLRDTLAAPCALALPAGQRAAVSFTPDGRGGGRIDGICRTLTAGPRPGGVLIRIAADAADKALLSVPLSETCTASYVPAVDPVFEIGTLTFHGARVCPDRVVSGLAASALTGELTAVSRIMAAAELTGAMQWALDASVSHAGDRVQFGRPLGAFQAVAHACADLFASLELCRSLVYAAMSTAGPSGAPDQRTAARAALLLHRRSLDAATTAIHLLGAQALRQDGDAHRHLRRVQVRRTFLDYGPQLVEQSLP